MDKDLLNIKLMVADRLYPLSIDPSEEESFRLAAKKDEDDKQEQITKKLQDIYAVLNSLA